MEEKNIAIMYDFDDTLAPGNMQEHLFIPLLDMKPEEFWNEVDDFKIKNNMDNTLACMYMMFRKAKERDVSIKKESFAKYGEGIEFFDGVEEWFDRINEYGKRNGVNVHHYVISSGLKEIIEGTKIANKFDKIYASSFLYNIDNIVKWPATAVNYTNKTQFIFRLNKGILEVSDDRVNDYMSDEDKSLPFENMIYIGDGMTDVPCMKIVKEFKGHSIAIHHDEKSRETAIDLLRHNRVNYVAQADYTTNSELDVYVKEIIDRIADGR